MGKHVTDLAANALTTDDIGGDDSVITGNAVNGKFKAIPSSKGFRSKSGSKEARLGYDGILFPGYTQQEIVAMQNVPDGYIVRNTSTKKLWQRDAANNQWKEISANSLTDVLVYDNTNSGIPIVGSDFLQADQNNVDVLKNSQGLALIQIGAGGQLVLPGFTGGGGGGSGAEPPFLDKIKVLTASYAMGSGDVGDNGTYTIFADATAGDITIALRGASEYFGKSVFVCKTDASPNSVIVQHNSSYPAEKINGVGSIELTTQYQTLSIISTGSLYIIK